MEFLLAFANLTLFQNSAILGNFSIIFGNIFLYVKMDIHTNFYDNSFKIEYFFNKKHWGVTFQAELYFFTPISPPTFGNQHILNNFNIHK